MEPDELNLYLIDTKKLDLPTLFKNLPHVLSVADDILAARQIFQDLLDLTRKRYDLLQAERTQMWQNTDVHPVLRCRTESSLLMNLRICLLLTRITALLWKMPNLLKNICKNYRRLLARQVHISSLRHNDPRLRLLTEIQRIISQLE